MNKRIHGSIFLFICLLISFKTFSQVISGNAAKQIYPKASQIIMSQKRNNISFIRLEPQFQVDDNDALSWLRIDILKMRSDDDLQQFLSLKDPLGNVHTRMHQLYKGVPVEYGQYILHSKNGKVFSANGEWYSNINISTEPKLSAAQAYSKAVLYTSATKYSHEREDVENNKLVVLPLDGGYALAYKCDIYAAVPLSRNWIYVDAINGNILKTESRIENTDVPGPAATYYSGTQTIVADSFAANSYRLREYTRGSGVETYNSSAGNSDFVDVDNNWNYYGGFDVFALDAHFGAEATYDFYYNNFGWSSVDGLGAQKLVSYVHAGPGINAFWDGTSMSYLDGDTANGVYPLTELDVAGHELTHGVTQNSSALIYSGESGALNESFSDIAGITIRFIHLPNSTWIIGDQCGYDIRDMKHPNLFECPDTYGGDFWNNLFGDVHIRSGIQNLWYVFLVEGAQGVNDNNDNYDVTGIGLTDAYTIALSNDMFYLTASSDYQAARDMSIQAATDFFGSCSPQVIQCTNAWYAVGVGAPFSDGVTANFVPSQTTSCTVPVTIHFDNYSTGATSVSWNFGDGFTSTALNPNHTYTSTGNYTVTLIASGTSACNGSDTTTQQISFSNIGTTIAPSCTPITTGTPGSFGIYQVQFNTIDHFSPGDDGYQDYTCSQYTNLIAGDPYYLKVNTNPELFTGGAEEDCRAWIDYNNDGMFDASELVLVANNEQGEHDALVQTSSGAILGVPLRLRIIDAKQSETITDACYNPSKGQCEDYAIVFSAPSVAPVTDFVGTPVLINVNSSADFTNLCSNVPISFQWTFEGGNPPTSTDPNPQNIFYDVPGVYDVTLITTNAFGSDTLVKSNYITVNPAVNMCSVSSVDFYEGGFFDSGGPNSNYGNNENCSLLIQPPCAGSITLGISNLQTQAGDEMRVYDGPDSFFPLLALITYNLNPPISVVSTGGSMFITWVSDGSGTKSGYDCQWSSTVGGLATPVADFSISNTNAPLNTPVAFTDLSANLPITWSWDFGDGNFSTQHNPSHTYTTPANYTVTLIASNCGGSDTAYHSLDVQQAAVFSITPPSIQVDITCVDSVVAPVVITNSGNGDLVYSTDETTYNFEGSQPNMVVLTYGADLTTNYPNTFTALNQNYTNYTSTALNTTGGTVLANALANKNVFLMTRSEGDPLMYLNYATALQNFASNGGSVILCGTTTNNVNCIFNTGLLSGTFYNGVGGLALNVLSTTHPITQGLPSVIANAPSHTYALAITNTDFIPLIECQGVPVVGYRNVGYGRVIYIGFDYNTITPENGLVLGNTLSWINSLLIPDWIVSNPFGDGTVPANSTLPVNITIHNYGQQPGTYTEDYTVSTNDALNPSVTIPIEVTIGNSPCVFAQYALGCSGQVCFDDSITSFADITSFVWNFGDGNSSTQHDPCHTYPASGTYDAEFIACSASGCDTIPQTVVVNFVAAGFFVSGSLFENNPVFFTDLSSNAVSWNWDFGDGNSSSTQNTQNTYADPGTYYVVLTVTDANGCTASTTDTVTILGVGISDPLNGFNISIYPNPTEAQTVIQYSVMQPSTLSIELWNEIGEQVLTIMDEQNVQPGKYALPFVAPASGVYLLRTNVNGRILWNKIVQTE